MKKFDRVATFARARLKVKLNRHSMSAKSVLNLDKIFYCANILSRLIKHSSAEQGLLRQENRRTLLCKVMAPRKTIAQVGFIEFQGINREFRHLHQTDQPSTEFQCLRQWRWLDSQFGCCQRAKA